MSLIALSASTIAQLAFSEFLKAGVGELAKKSVGEVMDLSNHLRKKIWLRFTENPQIKAALLKVEQQGDSASLDKVIRYLDAEMQRDNEFALEIQQLAEKITNYKNQSLTTLKQQNNNYGRD